MTPTDFRAALATLHWTQRGLAGILGCSESLVRCWASGSIPVPSEVAAWLRALLWFHARHPAPTGWRQRVA
jgi:hypothetical protein